MKTSIRLAWLLPTLVFLAAPARAELFAASPADLAAEAAAAAREGKRLAVLFEQEDCDSCRKLRKSVLSVPAAEAGFARQYRSIRVDLGAAAAITLPDGRPDAPRAWAQRLRIVGTPALAFFDGQGHLLYRQVGAPADTRELLLLGRYVEAAEYETRPFASYLSAQRPARRPAHGGRGEPCHTAS